MHLSCIMSFYSRFRNSFSHLSEREQKWLKHQPNIQKDIEEFPKSCFGIASLAIFRMLAVLASLLLRPIWWLCVKIPNLTIRNFPRILFPYYRKAISTQDDTIFSIPMSSLFYGLSGNRTFDTYRNPPSASGTPEVRTTLSEPSLTLSVLSITDSRRSKSHNSPPSTEWHKDRNGDYMMYDANSKWTGIAVDKIVHLWVIPAKYPITPPRNDRKILTLKHPSFRISQYIGKYTHYLIEAPTLNEAQKIAEWYYTEWLKVNHFSKN